MTGTTGIDIFVPNSKISEYVSSGITSLIPGNKVSNAVISNVISEAIVYVEDRINGDKTSVVDSIINIVVNSTLDFGFGYISTKVEALFDSLLPRNYASFAGEQYKKNPNLSKDDIYSIMFKKSKTVRRFKELTVFMIDMFNSTMSNLFD